MGQALMDDGIMCQVSEDNQFEDGTIYYKFNTPEAADKQKLERQTYFKHGWLEKKGVLSWQAYWFELKGNIVRYFSRPGGSLKGKFNVLNCSVCPSPSPKTFDVKTKTGSSMQFRAESEEEMHLWINMICDARDRTITQTDDWLKMWNQENECISCIAAEANEQAAVEDAEESTDNAAEAPSQLHDSSEVTAAAAGNNNKSSSSSPAKRTLMKKGSSFLFATHELTTEEKESMDELMALPLEDQSGHTVALKSAFGTDVIVLSLLRHFG